MLVYHHGEASLQGAIINMAQNFVGSNNINVLMPNGQFGTSRAAVVLILISEHIFKLLNPIVDTIYPMDDMSLVTYKISIGLLVEPEYYVPIIPMVIGSVWLQTPPQSSRDKLGDCLIHKRH